MDTIMIERIRIDELTTLEMALQVYHKDKFLDVKRKFLGSEFNEEAQVKVWKNYHDLMLKAVSGGFEKEDFERLEFYRQLDGYFESVSDETRLFFPTEITRDESGQVVRITLDRLDNEITKRWFEHIYDVLIGREKVGKCEAKGCSNLFLRTRRGRKFCSDECRNRDWIIKNR